MKPVRKRIDTVVPEGRRDVDDAADGRRRQSFCASVTSSLSSAAGSSHLHSSSSRTTHTKSDHLFSSYSHHIMFFLLVSSFAHISSCTLVKNTSGAVTPPPQQPSSSSSSSASSSSSSPSYSWKAEIWGACYSNSGCGDGQKSRTVICSDGDGLKVANSNCVGQKRPKTRESCFKVCQKYVKYVSWKIGDWSECRPSRRRKRLCVGQLAGAKSRTVQCVFKKNNYIKMLDVRACDKLVMPQTRVTCKVPCPQNCIVTKFSEWISCDGRCGVVTNRTRTRTVLVAPRHGGKKCPKLIEMTECGDEARPACVQSQILHTDNKLRIGPWSRCWSSEHEGGKLSNKPVIGHQIRSIECRNSYGTTLQLSNCKESGEKHETRRPCIMSSDCVMSSWSEWSVMLPGCVSSDSRHLLPEVRRRRRIVIRLPQGQGARCPFSTEVQHIKAPNMLTNCHQYKWIASEWTECSVIIQKGQDEVDRRKANCSGGLRQRNVTCVRRNDMRPVEEHLCVSTRLQTIKKCNVSCKQDCKVSQWSSWGPCRPAKSPVTAAFSVPDSGYKERIRYIVRPASSGGLQCPSLQEVEICDHPSWYQFEVGEWGECVISKSHQNCGAGNQKRTVRCLTLAGKEATDRLCKFFLPSPRVSKPCYVPCSGDCALSHWSSWSSCSHLCSDDGGATGLRFRNRTILSFPSPERTKNQCPARSELKEEEACNNHNCQGIHWQTMPWRQCKAINRTLSCVNGKQKRRVYCLREGKYHVADKKCAPVPKPVDVRLCNNSCPQDCVVTKFSDWSQCPQECPKDLKSLPVKRRRRFVIQWARNGGVPCPGHLVETQLCPMLHCFKTNIVHEWRFGNWSLCEAIKCEVGYRTRVASCIRRENSLSEEVEPHFCLSDAGVVPKTVEQCIATCDKPRPCYLTAWSDWSGCNKDCGGHQTRTRSLIQGSHQNAYCKIYNLKEKSEISCPSTLQVNFLKNDWSHCINFDEQEIVKVNGLAVTGRCGIGSYYKKNSKVDTETCMQTGVVTDMCVNSCPFDCKMKSWSNWSPCSVHCGVGFRTRRRMLIALSNHGGRICPTLTWENQARAYEEHVDICVRTCTEYKWQASGWSQCDFNAKHDNVLCGDGYHSQTVICVKIAEASLPQQVAEHFCDPITKPDSQRRCEVPCPDKCVVGEWSSWTTCKLPCNSSQKRQRQRKMIRPPNQSYVNSLSCPALTQTEPCLHGANCFSYTWNITRWSSCILPEGAHCGQGHIRRGLSCQRSDGRIADNSFCYQAGLERPTQIETWCFIDCPVDCEVSQWSEWNRQECSKCGLEAGYMIRSRQILLMNSSTGQKCPDDLVQRKPCLYKACYYAEKTPWSACSLKESECGYGTRRRNLTCRRSDGHIVDMMYCLLANVTDDVADILDPQWLTQVKSYQSEENCFVPCPGDCVMSEWSPWSHCHRNCENGEKVGFQTKSRAVLAYPKNNGEQCPETLYETKPCIGGRCVTFNWKVISNRIMCSSSDNVLVIGGCENKPLPCVPKCTAAHTMCTTDGRCACRSGYKPVQGLAGTGDDVEREWRDEHHQRSASAPSTIVSCTPVHHGGNGSLTIPANMSLDDQDINVKFYPDENEFSFWMYGMIAIGTAFIIFVSVTVYLMCHSRIREQFEFLQGRMRQRGMSPPDSSNYSKSSNRWNQQQQQQQQQQSDNLPPPHHSEYLVVHKMEVD